MPVIQVISADMFTDDDDLAPTARSTPGPDGGRVPTGLAGYVWDGAAYCPECASDVEVTLPDGDGTASVAEYPAYTDDGTPAVDPNGFGVGVISCTDESDYPGDSCFVCHRRLQSNVLVYDDGPHPTPVVEVRDPDRVHDPVEAAVLEVDGDHVRVILLESFGSHGDAGTISWLPRGDVVDEYRDQLD